MRSNWQSSERPIASSRRPSDFNKKLCELSLPVFRPPIRLRPQLIGSVLDPSLLQQLISDITELKKRRERSPTSDFSRSAPQSFVPGEDCAPILCESTTSLRHNKPLPDFYQSVFGSTSGDHYPFPYHDPKDGCPTRCFFFLTTLVLHLLRSSPTVILLLVLLNVFRYFSTRRNGEF